ncbi:MAG TPA: molybdenum cofactor biosynthesis protein MoaE [bacterium]
MIKIIEGPIDVNAVIRDATGNECGAVVLFLGTVRNANEGKRVREIHYESYKKMSEKRLREIADETRKKWKTKRVSIVHRVGRLKVGEISVAIASGAPHRKEAFEACRYAIEQIKVYLPIWKQEFFKTGKAWVSGRKIKNS